MPASDQASPILPGLSPICGRAIEARFDGELMSSDGGLLVLREVEQRLGIAGRLAACIRDPRAPERIVHGLDEIIRFRMLMIAAGYEDGNDADSLRADPLFKLAMDRLPEHGDLCSQSTVSRAENLPDRHALLRMARPGRPLLPELPAGAAPHRARHRRHLRRSARWPATAPVQRPLR